jgi:Tfp pilus assembly protein PilO
MKAQERQRILVILAVAAAAILIGDKLIYSPLSRMWEKRNQEIHRLRTQLTEGTGLVKREEVLRSRWDEMRKSTLPDNPSLAQERVLKEIQEWAQESGASINAVSPQWKADSDEYKTLVCRVDASGTLWMLSRFIYNIERSSLALRVESVDLTSRDNTGQQLALGLQLSALALTPQSR